MQGKIPGKPATHNALKNCPRRYKVEYGLILVIALFALSISEFNDQGHGPRRRSYLERTKTDILNDKSKIAPSLHRRLMRRSMKNHITQTEIWQHKCDRKPSNPWSTQLPVVFYCIPISFLNTTDGKLQRNKTISSKKTNKFSPGPTDDLTTHRTPRNLDRALMNASLQFDVPVDVTDLRLWFQGIVSVEDNSFRGLNSLKLLGLQHNEISYLSRDAFAGLIVLEQLDLSHNRLIAIHNTVFRHLQNLTTLNLRFNEIIFIQNSMFCGLERISVLDLSYNMIEEIDKHALQHFQSSYALTIDVTHNRLKTPKAEWLMLGPDTSTNANCRVESPTKTFKKVNVTKTTTTPQFGNNMSGMEIIIKNTDDTDIGMKNLDRKYSIPPVRLLRAANNPWSCECDVKMRLIEFIQQYQSVFSAQLNGAATVEDATAAFRTSNTDTKKDEDLVSKVADSKAYASWYFNMPCSEKKYRGIDLGRLTSRHRAIIEKSCCQKLSESSTGNAIIAKNKVLRNSCKKENATTSNTLTDNHVTIIGIVIVFSTPILLTLCPDCNRTVAPSSRNDMVTSTGKFGAVSLNANNNTGPWIERNSRQKPFENERFCLVVQEHTQVKKVFKSETAF